LEYNLKYGICNLRSSFAYFRLNRQDNEPVRTRAGMPHMYVHALYVMFVREM